MVRVHINSDSGDPKSEETPPREEAPEAAGGPPAPGDEPVEDAQAPKAEEDDAEKFRKQAEEYLGTLRRVQADFENYKKRVKKEKAETIAYANEEIIKRLLGVADNLDRGISCAEGEGGCEEDLLAGIRLVRKQFLDVLSDYGVQPFEAAGKRFDPALHECMYVLERDDLPDQTVVEELERGFRMRERVLRAAKVSVSKQPGGAENGEETGGDAREGEKT